MQDEALLFLSPVRPRSVATRGAVDVRGSTADRWGLEVTTGGAELVLLGPAGVRRDVDSLVVASPASARPARRRGEQVVAYVGWGRRQAELVLRPAPLRLCRLLGALRRTPTALVLGQRSTAPVAVREALPDAVVERVLLSSAPRRRAAYVVASPGPPHGKWLVKAAIDPDGGRRCAEEQRLLRSVHELVADAPVPVPHGDGSVDGLAWSVETAAEGTALPRATARWWRADGQEVLLAVGSWLESLAARSAHRPSSAARSSDRGIQLRGAALEWAGPILEQVRDFPAVMVHGDLGTGTNVLAAGRTFCIIDWETGVPDGLPLVDLVPFLCWGLARRRRLVRPDAQASFVVALCRGELPESRLFFSAVSQYGDRLGLAAGQVAHLAALAWGHQASMRVRHDELLAASGSPVATWQSLGELVLARWIGDPRLGVDWRAYRGKDQS